MNRYLLSKLQKLLHTLPKEDEVTDTFVLCPDDKTFLTESLGAIVKAINYNETMYYVTINRNKLAGLLN